MGEDESARTSRISAISYYCPYCEMEQVLDADDVVYRGVHIATCDDCGRLVRLEYTPEEE
jgi:hypothetical protein